MRSETGIPIAADVTIWAHIGGSCEFSAGIGCVGPASRWWNLTKGRANVAFCDGHAEFIQRSESFDARFWDPRKN